VKLDVLHAVEVSVTQNTPVRVLQVGSVQDELLDDSVKIGLTHAWQVLGVLPHMDHMH